MPNLVQHMPCKIKWQGFLPRIPNQKAMYNRLDTHNLRPGCGGHMAAVCIWTNMHHQTVSFHTGQQWLTSTDEGFFIHTCQCSGVSPQSNITAASDYFYMHTIIWSHLAGQSQPMQQLHFLLNQQQIKYDWIIQLQLSLGALLSCLSVP